MTKKKEIIIIVASIVLVIAIIAGILIYSYYKKLDGRECLDCPYVYDLTPADVVISNKTIAPQGGRSGYKATVTIGTVHDKLKVDGTVTLQYSCTVNYCFSASYVGTTCSWNYPANGTKVFNFDDESSVTETFTIQVVNAPTSIYMYQNKIDCNLDINKTTGSFKIYGEKLNR